MRPSRDPDRPALGNGTVRFRTGLSAFILAALTAFTNVAVCHAQTVDPQPSASTTASTGAPSVASTPKATAKVAEGLRWQNLTAAQRTSLAPLADEWSRISDAQRRKWLAVARDYPKLSPPEQATLQSRMKEWVAMGPKQRAEARLNFAEAKKLSPEDRKAKWDAYQSLSPEEREKLASTAPRSVKGAAPALRPVASERLARVPAPEADQAKPPRIAATPQQVDHNTLLPQQTAQ